MKLLLVAINAKYIHVNLAVRSLYGYVMERNPQWEEQIQLIEYTINHTEEEVREAILKEKPDMVCFSCYLWNRRMIEDLMEDLPKLLPDCTYWVGGPEVTYDGRNFLAENPAATGVMVGEGEAVFEDLCRHFLENDSTPLTEIKGLNLRGENGEFVETGVREPLPLDAVPFVYNDDNIGDYANRILYYETSRGCPFSCSYCLSSLEKKVRIRSFEKVEKELEFFLKHKVVQVKFVDRTFNCNHRHAQQIWRYIKEHDNGITNFHFEIAGDLLNREEIELLQSMRPGLIQMEIGVQSTNLHTITEINRKMDLNVLARIVEQLKKNRNFHIHLDLIAGLPYEDYESFRSSFDDVYSMGPNELQLGFLKVLHGSGIAKNRDSYGIVSLRRSPYEVLFTKWISHEELLSLKLVEEMLEVHFNSIQFPNVMKELTADYSRPIESYEALGEFYTKKGAMNRKVGRGERFELLNEFLGIHFPEKKERYAFLLAMDLFGRENLKNRPSWAPEKVVLSDDKIRDFYHKEKENGTFLEGYRSSSVHQIQSMTHLEKVPMIDYDVYGLEAPEAGKDWYALFDYRKRNPVTENVEPIFLQI